MQNLKETRKDCSKLLMKFQHVQYLELSEHLLISVHILKSLLLKNLSLKPEPISTQIIPRDRHAYFFNTLALIASSAERLATEIRHLQRTEVLEAEDTFHLDKKVHLLCHIKEIQYYLKI